MELAICLADPGAVEGSAEEIRALPFGEAEADRLLAIGNLSARRQSACARRALYALLAREGVSPLPIVREENGKPCFAGDSSAHFSLSHSPTLVAAALWDTPVGIDVEPMRRGKNEAGIVRRFFTEEERRLWEQNPSPDRFYALWTQKEATAKLDGGGLLRVRNIACYKKTFRLRRKEDLFFLSVAAKEPITSIHWMFHEKELTIDELPN